MELLVQIRFVSNRPTCIYGSTHYTDGHILTDRLSQKGFKRFAFSGKCFEKNLTILSPNTAGHYIIEHISSEKCLCVCVCGGGGVLLSKVGPPPVLTSLQTTIPRDRQFLEASVCDRAPDVSTATIINRDDSP